MRLIEIVLKNWKSHRRLRLDIPSQAGRPVVVIEGANGAGKTSLLEAIILCLYGRGGLGLVARASLASRTERSYDAFVERALHISSRTGPTTMSVGLTFATSEGEIAVERVWHFSNGGLRKNDEEVRIYVGADREIVPLPEAEDSAFFIRDFVADKILPDNLAGFFMLDGEHLERMASTSADGQIRAALETAMGTDRIRKVADDLRSYARERRRQLPNDAAAVRRAADDLSQAEKEVRAASERAEELIGLIGPLRKEREAVVSRIGALHGESYRALKDLFEKREKVVRDRDGNRDELRRLLSGEVALALAGDGLRSSAAHRLAGEEELARLRNGSAQNLDRFPEFVALVEQEATQLSSEQRQRLADAWHRMWALDGAENANFILFTHLGEADRRSVAEQLQRLGSVQADHIAGLARMVADADRSIEAVDRQLGSERAMDDVSKELGDKLNELQSRLSMAEAQHAAEVSKLGASQERLARHSAELNEHMLADSESGSVAMRTGSAERYAELIDALVVRAMPSNLDALSEIVTKAYRTMAHKTVVEKIVVDEHGKVSLLDAQGRNMQDLDPSAGESHVFALSVMSALSSLAPDFPIIMDSPLARLDPIHRRKVLSHFSSTDQQLILLVHPAELRPEEMEFLAERSAGTVHLGNISAGASEGTPA